MNAFRYAAAVALVASAFATSAALRADSPKSAPSPSSVSPSVSPSAPSSVPSSVVEDNAAFARDLYAQLKKSRDNMVLGPTSISTALAMTWAGARGKTASEMGKTLHFNQANEHEAQGALLTKLASSSGDGPRVSIANRLFAQKGTVFELAFVKLTGDRYGAPIESLDFAGATEPSRKIIDAWVKEKTNAMIPELLGPGGLSATTRLVLVDAMAFEAAWWTAFSKDATRSETFTTKAGDKKVPMMHGLIHSRLGETPDARILSMPYASKDPARRWSMVIVLPKGDDADLGKAFAAPLSPANIPVSLPKFKLRTHVDLADTLQKMGIHDAFDAGKADFGGITKQPIMISKVIHEAFIEVDEAGTRAAAATAVVTIDGAAVPSKKFEVNKPFTFAVRDDTTGAILFLGHVSDPLAS